MSSPSQKPLKPNESIENIMLNSLANTSGISYTSNDKNIKITAWPEFVDSQNSTIGNVFVWIYHIRIDNNTNETIKLINRYWKIIDEKGAVQEVEGEGVIGEQPKIIPKGSFQYSSGVHLRHPSGIMGGRYQMQKDNGETFYVEIPTFSLDVPSLKEIVN